MAAFNSDAARRRAHCVAAEGVALLANAINACHNPDVGYRYDGAAQRRFRAIVADLADLIESGGIAATRIGAARADEAYQRFLSDVARGDNAPPAQTSSRKVGAMKAVERRNTRAKRQPVTHPDLPFVVDFPDPRSPRHVVRSWWTLPLAIHDYSSAYSIGEEWACRFLDYSARLGSLADPTGIMFIVDAMDAVKPTRPDSRGFCAGFMNTIAVFAVQHVRQGADALTYARQVQQERARYRLESDERRREEKRGRVARMNAGRLAKRVIARVASKPASGGLAD